MSVWLKFYKDTTLTYNYGEENMIQLVFLNEGFCGIRKIENGNSICEYYLCKRDNRYDGGWICATSFGDIDKFDIIYYGNHKLHPCIDWEEEKDIFRQGFQKIERSLEFYEKAPPSTNLPQEIADHIFSFIRRVEIEKGMKIS
jgi:hypothetical protein